MLVKAIAFITFSSIPLAWHYYIKAKYKKKMQIAAKTVSTDSNNYYYQCVFITMKNAPCKEHIIANYSCGDNCSLNYLQSIVNFIASSKRTISICMYILTLGSIHDALLKAHNRGVIIRIITDPIMMRMKPSKFRRLNAIDGVRVKVPLGDSDLMHHKFCLVDENDPILAKMFMGSLNLTFQGFTQNYEFVVFTNNSEWIQWYREEFEEIWKECKLSNLH